MQATSLPTTLSRSTPGRRFTRTTVEPSEQVASDDAPAEPSTPTVRHRRIGGPQDHALYFCGCGYAFMAEVTASVSCPHCAIEQAW